MAEISLPAWVEVMDVDVQPMRAIKSNRSPYSLGTSRTDWGGEAWEATLVTNPLSKAEAMRLLAWCNRAFDVSSVVRCGHFQDERLGTSTATQLTVAADAAPYQRLVPVSGIGAGKTLEEGTFVTVSGRLHQLRGDVTGGAATLSLFPRLRETVFAGAAITVGAGVTGRWLLNEIPPLQSRARKGFSEPMTLKLTEAI